MYPIPPLLFAMPRCGLRCAGPFSWHLLALVVVLGPVAPAAAQGFAVVRSEENLRAAPNGEVIGRASVGTRMAVVRRQDRWVEVTFEGWVWLPSLRSRSGGSFDLTVSAAGGENLRAQPRGPILARLETGTLLEEEERIIGWARVRRTAWIWGPSVTVEEVSVAAPVAPPASAPPPAETRWLRTEGRTSPVLTAPDGDTLAMAVPGAELRLLAREGNWVRVQVDGWIWSPEGSATQEGITADGVDVEAVMQDPEQYRGRVVTWELQFIALEAAERVRTDFFQGEPYLLTRARSADGAFVYVTVPPERLAEIRGLTPLERIRVVGRVRTGADALTGSPILDLVEIRRTAR